jgi:hypothetical protein
LDDRVCEALIKEQRRLLQKVLLITGRLWRQRERTTVVTCTFWPEDHESGKCKVAAHLTVQLGVLLHKRSHGHGGTLREAAEENLIQSDIA